MVIEVGKTPVVECDVEARIVQHDGVEKEAGGHRGFPCGKRRFLPVMVSGGGACSSREKIIPS